MKHAFSVLLIGFLSLLCSVETIAEAKYKVKSIDLTIDLPKGGMLLEDGEKVAITSAKTAFGDLFEKGIISLYDLTWDGEFDTSDDGMPKFKAGYSYTANIKLMLDTNGPYVCNYEMRYGDYYLDDTMLKVTVNGKPANVRISAPYFPGFNVVLTVPGGKGGKLEKEDLLFDYTANKKKNRATKTPYTTAAADAACGAMHPHDVVTVTTMDDLSMFKDENRVFLTKVILDTNDKETYIRFAETLSYFMNGYYNLKEVWLSDKVDALAFVKALNEGMRSKLDPDVYTYFSHSTMFFTGEATLCIPAKSAAEVKALLAKSIYVPCYTVKTYTGDVFQKQKGGVEAAQDLCTKHNFISDKILAADRVMRYSDCRQPWQRYYSCSICGKCERNPNHTFSIVKTKQDKADYDKVHHCFRANLATEQAYVGTNAAGEHVYWQSCIWCGMSYNYDMHHLTEAHVRTAGNSASLPLYRKHMEALLEMRESDAKIHTTPQPDMFTLPARSTAKMSTWAQDEVNRALCDNLIDEQLLGNDYTTVATRLQVVSIAVRLAEEMIGKPIEAAKKTMYRDCDDEYVRKACAMELMEGIADDEFAPSANVTRQEMAALIYRAMRYVEKNSKYTYTDYESHLSAYTDCGQLNEWAKEPMAFMEALELIDPTAPSAMSPQGNCSLELALVTAERATMAQHTGWAQVIGVGEKDEFISLVSTNDALGFMPGAPSSSTLGYSDRVWVYRQKGAVATPVIKDHFTGQKLYFNGEFLRPVRWRGGSVKDAARKVTKTADKVSKTKDGVKNLLKKGSSLLKGVLK